MSTNARIGIELEDGSIMTSYHHWDGYPGGLGYNLVENWSYRDRLIEAIKLGDASYWGVRIDPIGHHTFDKPEEGVNVYYGRDRGEKGVHSITFENLETMITDLRKGVEEFAYVYTLDDLWIMVDIKGKRVVYDAMADVGQIN